MEWIGKTSRYTLTDGEIERDKHLRPSNIKDESSLRWDFISNHKYNNAMLGYNSDTPQHHALREKMTLFQRRLKELTKEDCDDFGDEYKKYRKEWWEKAKYLTFNDQTLFPK